MTTNTGCENNFDWKTNLMLLQRRLLPLSVFVLIPMWILWMNYHVPCKTYQLEKMDVLHFCIKDVRELFSELCFWTIYLCSFFCSTLKFEKKTNKVLFSINLNLIMEKKHHLPLECIFVFFFFILLRKS